MIILNTYICWSSFKNILLSVVYLIPAPLEDESLQAIPAYVLDAVKQCNVFFVENERTARRYLKKLDKAIVIDDYEWFIIHKAEAQVKNQFMQKLKAGKTIGIISEAGCRVLQTPDKYWLKLRIKQVLQ